MLRQMPFDLFADWRAFADLEPFDEERMDLRFASVVQAVVNMQRDTKRRPTPYPLSDFVLYFGDAKPPKMSKSGPAQSWQQMKLIGQAWSDVYKQ